MTRQPTAQQIATEITECLAEERIGRVLDYAETTIRIQFDNVIQAAHWISNYASLDLTGAGTTFETPATAWNQPVTVLLELAAYDYAG